MTDKVMIRLIGKRQLRHSLRHMRYGDTWTYALPVSVFIQSRLPNGIQLGSEQVRKLLGISWEEYLKDWKPRDRVPSAREQALYGRSVAKGRGGRGGCFCRS